MKKTPVSCVGPGIRGQYETTVKSEHQNPNLVCIKGTVPSVLLRFALIHIFIDGLISLLINLNRRMIQADPRMIAVLNPHCHITRKTTKLQVKEVYHSKRVFSLRFCLLWMDERTMQWKVSSLQERSDSLDCDFQV